MKKIILLCVAVATMFASCQKSQEQTSEVSGSAEVTFTLGVSTRANDMGWEENQEYKIGVFMYESGGSGIYAKNRLYATSDVTSGIFSSDDPLIYPEGSDVDFIAYYPYSDGVAGSVAIVSTVDQSSQEKIDALDFMVASATGCNEESTPTLNFSRKMSKIEINVTYKETMQDAILTDIELMSIATSGTFSFVNSSTGRENTSMVASETNSTISMFFNQTDNKIEAIIVPQTISSSKLVVMVDGEYFVTTISGKFEQAKQYNYNLVIGKDTVEFTEGTITDWIEIDIEGVESYLTPNYSYIQFKRNESNTKNITCVDDNGVIESLLAQFRRCLMKTDGKGNATICYLDNNNSNYYADGTPASLDGSEGDVMVYFPEYWYKYENIDDDYFCYHISESEQEGYVYVEASLVGAYKVYNKSAILYSISGVTPSYATRALLTTYASNRGTGFQLIDFEQHCTIAMMLYAKYSDRSIQSYLGTGGAGNSTTTGTTNSIGNADTSNESSGYVNGLGLEGVYGGMAEWLSGIYANYGRVWVIENPSNNDSYSITAYNGSYIGEMSLESGTTGYFDMVPTGGVAEENASNYYSSSYGTSTSSGNMYRATGSYASYVNVSTIISSSSGGSSYGTRLAFRGTILKLTNAAIFKAQ